ncbi:MAG TPA: PAS domain S-box protein [Victivallales bacterium]|nr:PAS domain S-box protein [Victivallales bacterium]
MDIDWVKIELLRKQKGLSVIGFCNLIGVTRAALWKWQKGLLNPTETNIRKLAQVLLIPVSEISELHDTVPVSRQSIMDTVQSWLSLKLEDDKYHNDIEKVLMTIKNLDFKLNRAVVLITSLLDSMKSIIYIKDINSKYLVTNKEFLKNISLPISYNAEGKKDKDFFSIKEANFNQLQDEEVLSSGNAVLNIEDYIPGSRKKKWGLYSKIPVLNREHKIIGIIGTFLDISDRKEAEKWRELLEASMNSTAHIFSIYDYKLKKFIFFSKEIFENISGYSIDRVFAKNGRNEFYVNTLTHPDDRHIHSHVENIVTWPYTRKKVFRIIRSDGDIRWLETFDSYINYSGKIYVVAVSHDVTDEKKIKLKLELLIKSLESLGLYIRILDDNNKELVSSSNKILENITDLKHVKSYKKNKNVTLLDLCHPDDLAKYQYIEKGFKTTSFKWRLICRNDRVKWLNTKVSKITYSDKDYILECTELSNNI